jgi:protein subunit release factor A
MVKRYWAILILPLMIVQVFPTAFLAGQAPKQSTASPIAVVSQRIEADRREVRLYKGKKLVQLTPFMEPIVVTPVAGQSKTIENLANRSVAIFRSEKNPDRWEVFQDVRVGTGGADALVLADNVFKVKQVLISSSQSPIELRLDEKIIRLKPGDGLLVL